MKPLDAALNPAHHNGAISVRPLQVEDAPILRAACWPTLSAEAVYERAARALGLARRGRVWPLVGLYDDNVVGFGQLARLHSIVEISDLVVGDGWQSRGVGTAIIHHLLTLAREAGFGRVEVGVAESNTRAHSLYRRLGFTRVESHLMLDLGNGPEAVFYLSRGVGEPHG